MQEFHCIINIQIIALLQLFRTIYRSCSTLYTFSHVCMSYKVPPPTYRRTPSSHKDRKGSFTTRPTGKVPGYKNVIKRAYCLQRPACWHNTSKAAVACLGVGKTREPGEKPPQACTEQANHVDITKHKCRDIGLPDGMGVPHRQAAQGGGLGNYPFGSLRHCQSDLDILAACPGPAYFRNARKLSQPRLFRSARDHHQCTD